MDNNAVPLLSVLVVEDDPGDALLIKKALLGSGSGRFVVGQVASLKEARQYLDDHQPDVLLLDLALPDSDGLATVKEMRRAAPDTPIVVLTGHNDQEFALTTLEAGAQDYLDKNALNAYSLSRSIRYAVTRARLENRLLESHQRLESLLDEVRSLNTFDTLTGLPNRRSLLEQLERSIAQHIRAQKHGALLGIDLGGFRVVNDTLGHDVGDLLLIEAARRLRLYVRETDIVARLGSDEFAVILEYLSGDSNQAAIRAEEVARKLRQAVNRPFLLRGHECHVSISIGICLYGHRDELFDELLIRANVATAIAHPRQRPGKRVCHDAHGRRDWPEGAGDPAGAVVRD